MTRGKYGAKAANRLAQLDSELVADLRAALAAVAAERDEARREVARLRDRLATDVNRAARDLADGRIAEVQQDLVAERAARSGDRERLAQRMFDVLVSRNSLPVPSVLAELAEVFGVSANLGALVAPDLSRTHRRATAKSARLRGDFNAAPDWLKAPMR